MRLQVKGLDEYANKVKRLSKNEQVILKKAVFSGAAPVADATKAGLLSLPIQNDRNNYLLPPYAHGKKKIVGVSSRQKADLVASMGLAPIENQGGYINTKLGFDGYGSVPTKQWPNGIPNALLMRSVESGTSFRKKTPVISRAVNATKGIAISKMSETIDKELKKEGF